MAKSRVITCPDVPRTVSIYAKLDNDSCGQHAHMLWPHLALPLLLCALQPHWLAFNSSKHCISPNLGAFALFLLCTICSLSPPTFFFSYLSCSLSPNITSSERPLPHSQTGVVDPLLYTPLHFFHSTYNKPHDYYLSAPLDYKLFFWSGSSLYLWCLAQGLTHSKYWLNEWTNKLH